MRAEHIYLEPDVVRKTGLSLAACDVGGGMGRKIVFHAHTGRVLPKRTSKRPPGRMGVRFFAKRYLLPARGPEAPPIPEKGRRR